MSRRDELVETLGDAFRALGGDLRNVLDGPTDSSQPSSSRASHPPPPRRDPSTTSVPSRSPTTTSRRRPTDRIDSMRQTVLDLVDNLADGRSSAPSSSFAPNQQSHRRASSPGRRSTPAPPLPQRRTSVASPRVPYESARERHRPIPQPLVTEQAEPSPSPADDVMGDELPAYSRRAVPMVPTAANGSSSANGSDSSADPLTVLKLPISEHSYTSRSGRSTVRVTAPGDQHVVIVQSAPAPTTLSSVGPADSIRTPVRGEVDVDLPVPEAITHIKLRVKALTRTLVIRTRPSAPVMDEALLFEHSTTLWAADPDGVGSSTAEPPDGNVSSEPGKLQGKFTFPFELFVPARMAGARLVMDARERALRNSHELMPPSFVLETSRNGPAAAAVGTDEWASCRFFIKLTVGRRGLFKQNERLVVPFVYVPWHEDPPMSPLRTHALLTGQTPPGPVEDPSGYAGRKLRRDVHKSKLAKFGAKVSRKSVASGGGVWFESIVLVPTPLKYARLSSIDVAIKIASSDPSLTTRFPLESISVSLIQRAFLSARSFDMAHDLEVAKGELRHEGSPDGEPLDPSVNNGAVWGKHVRASIPLGSHVNCSFRAPLLAVHFFVLVKLKCPGNDLSTAIPVEVLSSFSRLSTPSATPLDLPPSYFEAVEDNSA